MREPTDAELAHTIRWFADYLADELGWLSDGPYVLDHLHRGAQRLEVRSAAPAMYEALTKIADATAFGYEARDLARAALKAALEPSS